MTPANRGGVSEAAITERMGQIEVIEATDPRAQIPPHRRYVTAFLGGGKVGVWDRWEDRLHAECPGGCPDAAVTAAALNGRAAPEVLSEADLALGALIGGLR